MIDVYGDLFVTMTTGIFFNLILKINLFQIIFFVNYQFNSKKNFFKKKLFYLSSNFF